jgi:hypothetical protein
MGARRTAIALVEQLEMIVGSGRISRPPSWGFEERAAGRLQVAPEHVSPAAIVENGGHFGGQTDR